MNHCREAPLRRSLGSPPLQAMIRIDLLSILLAVALGIAAIALAPPVRADECGGGCIQIEDIGNPEYLHFYISDRENKCTHYTHWNILLQGQQSELAIGGSKGNCRTKRLYIAAKPGSSHEVTFQRCRREGVLGSICGPWQTVTLVKPNPEFAGFCTRYADDAVEHAKRNKQLRCGLESDNPARWTTNRESHLNWCLAQEGVYAEPTTEGSYRVAGLKECAAKQEAMKEKGQVLSSGPKVGDILKETKPPAAPPVQPPAPPAQQSGGGQTATVIADVDVYKAAGGAGKSLGVLRSNNKTTKVSLVAPCQDNWCHVEGAPVPTGEGWVYSGTFPDFQSLQF